MSETIKAVLSIVSVGGALWVLFMIFTRRAKPDAALPAKEREIHVDFDKQRETSAKRINALEREDMNAEWQRDRSKK